MVVTVVWNRQTYSVAGNVSVTRKSAVFIRQHRVSTNKSSTTTTTKLSIAPDCCPVVEIQSEGGARLLNNYTFGIYNFYTRNWNNRKPIYEHQEFPGIYLFFTCTAVIKTEV